MTRRRLYGLFFVILLSWLFWGCGEIVEEPPGSQEKPPSERQHNSLPDNDSTTDAGYENQLPDTSLPPEDPPVEQVLPPPDNPPAHQNRTAYTIQDAAWTETAVRKVLHIFAFGGFASDTQIKAWAGMKPEQAIDEMLSFQPYHPKLSPPDPLDRLDQRGGTLTQLGAFWSSTSKDNPTQAGQRSNYNPNTWDALSRIWLAAATRRGLNPVRQRIGLWETNYHMAVNRRAQVSNDQLLVYYDGIMNALAANKPYQDVMAIAALTAAVATQYNHKENIFKDGKFIGNEDFAREFFQLFFGILGTYDPSYHEFTSIRNTAKALTDMTVKLNNKDGGSWDAAITFGTKYHYPGSLEILNTEIAGKTAKEKIERLAQVAIQHKESLENLPLIIVRGLADDNLTSEKTAIIRKLWADLKTKNLLLFLKRYAISTAFHHPTRLKFWSSIGRNVLTHNRLALGNQASYLDLYRLYRNVGSEGVVVFEPTHDVFGGQTGSEASQSADVFRDAYNRSTELLTWITRSHWTAGGKVVWEKDWAKVLPQTADKTYRVKEVAEWLWQRFIADGLKNFGALERAHVYALLSSGTDLGYWLDPRNPSRVYTKQELETDRYLQERISDAGKARIDGLDSKDTQERRAANARIGLAIGFIIVTPYMFAQQGQ